MRITEPKFKTRFIIGVVVYTVLLSLSVGLISVYNISTELRDQFEQRAEGLTAYLVEETRRALQMSDGLNRYFSFLFLTARISVGDVVYAQIVRNGSIQSQYIRDPDIHLDVLEPPTVELETREVIHNDQRYMDYIRPLTDHSGYVRVGLTLELIEQKVRQTLILTGTICLLFIVAGLAGAFGLYSALLKPIHQLIASIRRIGSGDTQARVPVPQDRELAELAIAFNDMAKAISERDRELQRQNAELQEAYQAKSDFLAMMGHELKTPLHAMRGSSQLLLEQIDGTLNPRQQEDVRSILSSGNHLLALIDNLLRYNALGSDNLHITRVDVGKLICQCIDYVTPIAHSKGISLEADVQPSHIISADETKLKQILLNLLINGIYYSERGHVRVKALKKPGAMASIAMDATEPLETESFGTSSLEKKSLATESLAVEVNHTEPSKKEWYTVIEVIDQGPGIPPEDRQRIFEPFERLNANDKPDDQGLGLGLTIVRKYVTMHGGSIDVEDAPGGGSLFRLTLPHKIAEASPHKEVEKAG